MATIEEIAKDGNAWDIITRMNHFDATLGKVIPSAGVGPLTGRLTADEDGLTKIGNSEVSMPETGRAGTYHGTLTGSILKTDLTAITPGTLIYEVALLGTTMIARRPLRVVAYRRA